MKIKIPIKENKPVEIQIDRSLLSKGLEIFESLLYYPNFFLTLAIWSIPIL